MIKNTLPPLASNDWFGAFAVNPQSKQTQRVVRVETAANQRTTRQEI
jgi:hypothetical protein